MISISYFSIVILTFVCHLTRIILFIILQYFISSSDFIDLCVDDSGFSSSEEESLLSLISLNFLLSSRMDNRSSKYFQVYCFHFLIARFLF
jgi:hypothetical protein